VYRYDGSFEGVLCAVAVCLAQGEIQPEFEGERANRDDGLFAAEVCPVATVRETAAAFRKCFVQKVSRDAFAAAYYAFYSKRHGIENLLWRYFKLGLEEGGRLGSMLTVEPVYSIHRIARQVCHEAHKFKGFVRFQEVEAGFLYARIEPKSDILPLIARHFAERTGDRPCMIHDIGRCQAVVYDMHSWRFISEVELTAEPGVTDGEKWFACLWQSYFRHHAINERHNSSLQQKHIPLRYRKFLTELQSGG
jgi:probable DNA metabolism protein